jgi:hypothetical protein
MRDGGWPRYFLLMYSSDLTAKFSTYAAIGGSELPYGCGVGGWATAESPMMLADRSPTLLFL